MRIVFWLNSLSPHQLPYILHLRDDNRVSKVIIVAEKSISSVREKMGWENKQISNSDKCDIFIAPKLEMIDAILSENPQESRHLFSGIRGFEFVFNVFKLSLKYNLKRGIIVEIPNTYAYGLANAKPLWLHATLFHLYDRKYAKAIDFVFAMGYEAAKYYKSLWNNWNVYSFAYCTNNNNFNIISDTELTGTCKFIFIGSLTKRKATIDIINADRFVTSKSEISIIGDGPEKNLIEKKIQLYNLNNITLLGTQKQSEIPNFLSKHDILILPSIHDGWGAVVNEALQQGNYVICSNHCGANTLLKDKRCGYIFESGSYKELAQVMEHCINNIESIRKDRKFRQIWAINHISGEVISRYMVDCLDGIKTKAPWE